MKAHTGFMIVHKSKWLKWLKPDVRVCVHTFDRTIVNNEEWPSFQTVSPNIVNAVNVASVDIQQHEWLYDVVLLDNLPAIDRSEQEVHYLMCCKEV
jgi:hypothetical protein